MRYYLSSYKFGNEIDRLKTMLPVRARVGHINNAKDFTNADLVQSDQLQQEQMHHLRKFGFTPEAVDLKDYFFKKSDLEQKLQSLDGIWVSGGNTFVLRQAMRLSGFDELFEYLRKRAGFLYGGYSAGVCVLCDSLKYIQNVDNPNDFPYEYCTEAIWEGLNVFNHGILPHYDSNHFESEEIGKEVFRCIDNKWLFMTLRDGEVLIKED